MAIEARNMQLVGQNDIGGLGDCMHVNVVDGYAYVGHQGHTPNGVSILDVSNPENPKLVASIPRPSGTHTHKVQVVGDILLVNHERNRFEETPPQTWSAGMAIYDVSRPENPKQIGFFESPGTGVHRMTYWEEPYAFVSGTVEGFKGRILRIADLSDPSSPKEIGRWWLEGQHVAAGEEPSWDSGGREGYAAMLHHALPRGDRLYCGWWDTGMVILDISDLQQPTLVSRLDFGADSGNTHTALPVPGRDICVVTDEQLTAFIGTQRHVRVVDISDDSSPRVVSTLPVPPEAESYHRQGIRCGPHNLHEPRPGSLVDSDIVYLTYFAGGLRAYDVSDPANPTEVASIVPDAPPGFDAIYFNDLTATPDGLVYVTDRRAGGLYIVHHER